MFSLYYLQLWLCLLPLIWICHVMSCHVCHVFSFCLQLWHRLLAGCLSFVTTILLSFIFLLLIISTVIEVFIYIELNNISQIDNWIYIIYRLNVCFLSSLSHDRLMIVSWSSRGWQHDFLSVDETKGWSSLEDWRSMSIALLSKGMDSIIRKV